MARLESVVGREAVARYLGPGTGLTVDADGVRIGVPNRFAAEMIERRMGAALRSAVNGAVRYEVRRGDGGGGGDSVSGSVAEDAAVGGSAGRDEGVAGTQPVRVRETGGHRGGARGGTRGGGAAKGPAQTLEGFVVGASNRFAYTAVRRIASEADAGALGPVFLYGPCGVGKSHLLNAAVGAFRAAHPGARARVTTAEAFTNEFIAAIRSNTIEAFHRRYRRVDLLCVDDVHFLATKDGTQKELLHTFDQIGHGGGRIVLASDEHPGRIRKFSEALVSRFMSGSLVRIDQPDGETRRRLIERFASRIGLVLEAGAVGMLDAAAVSEAGGRGVSVRDLSGLVNRVGAYVSLMGRGGGGMGGGAIGPAEIEAALRAQGGFGGAAGREGAGDPSAAGAGGSGSGVGAPTRAGGSVSAFGASRPVPIGVVIERVCEAMEVTKDDLGSRGRHPRVVLARAAVAMLARRLTRNSYPEIAHAMGRRNHSTVITAHRRIERQIADGAAVEVGLSVDGLPISALLERIEREARASV